MVSAKIPKELSQSQELLGDRGELGKPLFAKLVPYSVHVAASIYADRRDRLVNQDIIAQLDDMTTRIQELLSSLNLPGSLQALEKPLGLPPSLSSHADEIRQSGGVQRVHALIADTDKVKTSVRQMYQEGIDLLRTEAGEDEAARRKFGTQRWSRPTAADAVPKLFSQVNDIDGYLKQANTSDRKVHDKLRENENLIRLLGGTDRDLEDYVPSSRRATMTAKVERAANTLRATINEVTRLESKRRKKVEALKTKARDDDVLPDLLRETAKIEREFPMQPIVASQFEHLFDARLQKFDSDQAEVKREDSELEDLGVRIQQVNTAFQTAKKGDTSTSERETALQNLENAYTSYKQALRDLDTGRKFYNSLGGIVSRFRDECKNFVYTRRNEAQNLESDLSTSMAGLHLQQQNAQNLLSQKHAQAQAQHAQQQHVPPPARMIEEPIPAPTPQRPQAQPPPAVTNVQSPGPAALMPGQTTWQEGMPIVFGGQNGNGAATSAVVDGRWDPSKGVKFVSR